MHRQPQRQTASTVATGNCTKCSNLFFGIPMLRKIINHTHYSIQFVISVLINFDGLHFIYTNLDTILWYIVHWTANNFPCKYSFFGFVSILFQFSFICVDWCTRLNPFQTMFQSIFVLITPSDKLSANIRYQLRKTLKKEQWNKNRIQQQMEKINKIPRISSVNSNKRSIWFYYSLWYKRYVFNYKR